MTTPAMTDQDRELFEAWAELTAAQKMGAQHDLAGWHYFDDDTEIRWEAWQAARALPQQVVAAGSIDTAELRKLALAATPGEWDFDTAETPFRIAGGEVVGGDALPWGDVYTVNDHDTFDEDGPCCEPLTIVREIKAADGRYIAAVNPKTILALLDALDARQPAPVKPEALTYGCHVDLDPGMDPDGCVIDSNRRDDCLYARRHEKKESCEYWKPVVFLVKQGAKQDE